MQLLGLIQDVIRNGVFLWKTWNLHGFVFFSLFIQLFLFLLAPFRQNTASWFLRVLVWSAYQLWWSTIAHTLALIDSKGHDFEFVSGGTSDNLDLYALWAAFMMVHFGGPDTITAQSLEDNQLWLRSYLTFISQLISTIKAVLAMPRDRLLSRPVKLAPALLVLAAGVVKSFERLFSLMYSCPEHLQKSVLPPEPIPVPDYAAIMEDYDRCQEERVPVEVVHTKESSPNSDRLSFLLAICEDEGNTGMELSEIDLVRKAHYFYEKFKSVYVGQIFCCHDRKDSRDYFLRLSSELAFRIAEMEMKFAYEGFYTKRTIFQYSQYWALFRYLALALETLALVFWVSVRMNPAHTFDTWITLCLCVGAVLIDVVAIVGLFFSDRAIASSKQRRGLVLKALSFRRRWSEAQNLGAFRVFFRHWSESTSQFNLISYCMSDSWEGCSALLGAIGAKYVIDGWKHVSPRQLKKDLKGFIYDELKKKSVMAKNVGVANEISVSRGNWVLHDVGKDLGLAGFEPWIMDVRYDESVLIWHIATELCYETIEGEPNEPEEERFRGFSKTLSDYMLHLVVRLPEMMSDVAPMSDAIFRDTCKEFKVFFQRVVAPNLQNAKPEAKEKRREACISAMKLRARVPASYVQGEGNNSVLLKACELANKLKGLKEKGAGQWELTSKVWLELLCYAASQSPADVHAARLAKGGELITLVCLLMLHLGINNTFREARNWHFKKIAHHFV